MVVLVYVKPNFYRNTLHCNFRFSVAFLDDGGVGISLALFLPSENKHRKFQVWNGTLFQVQIFSFINIVQKVI